MRIITDYINKREPLQLSNTLENYLNDGWILLSITYDLFNHEYVAFLKKEVDY